MIRLGHQKDVVLAMGPDAFSTFSLLDKMRQMKDFAHFLFSVAHMAGRLGLKGPTLFERGLIL